MKRIYFVLFLAALVLIAGCAAQTTTSGTAGNQQTGQQVTDVSGQTAGQQQTSAAMNVVEITSSGFSPKTLAISAGETVVFTNKDGSAHWPASAVHPTHSVYPESGGCIGSKFDACRSLAQDESFSFTFNSKGSWKYHDHLNPAFTGTIIVE
ncbi:cupredoxin domain-containing protein [Candidatus Woesearchaeota archaeon]|nr:cupredoxin domain-containing protein [Candidatus Woesearchaeota archaeon]